MEVGQRVDGGLAGPTLLQHARELFLPTADGTLFRTTDRRGITRGSRGFANDSYFFFVLGTSPAVCLLFPTRVSWGTLLLVR